MLMIFFPSLKCSQDGTRPSRGIMQLSMCLTLLKYQGKELKSLMEDSLKTLENCKNRVFLVSTLFLKVLSLVTYFHTDSLVD